MNFVRNIIVKHILKDRYKANTTSICYLLLAVIIHYGGIILINGEQTFFACLFQHYSSSVVFISIFERAEFVRMVLNNTLQQMTSMLMFQST